jgi:hypothetical protein
MLAPEAGRVWARVPRSAAIRSFEPRLRWEYNRWRRVTADPGIRSRT